MSELAKSELVVASEMLRSEFQSRGVAQVIVVLKPEVQTALAGATAGGRGGGRGGSAPTAATAAFIPVRSARAAVSMEAVAITNDLAKYFVTPETAQDAALVTTAGLAAAGERRGAAAARRGFAPRARAVPQVRTFPHLGVMLGNVDEQGLAGLIGDARVERVAAAPPISLVRPVRRTAAKLTQTVTWGIRALKVERLWRDGINGRGVRVGHLDTGVDGRHPALRRAVKVFAEFDALGFEVEPTPRAFDSDDHGTHTAGTIAGRPVNGRNIGVAPGADLVSGMVIEGGNVVARILAGMEWCITQRVRVLSMSLGLRGFFTDWLDVTRALRRNNVVPAFAVGNEGPGTSRSPGNYAEALSVGASDRSGRVADFSSSQRFIRPVDPGVPDMVAPGVAVVSAMPGGGYQSMDGTSMATPHVAGLAALLIQAVPAATAEQVERAILDSCQPLAGDPPTRFGRGFPDAVRALSLLRSAAGGAELRAEAGSEKRASARANHLLPRAKPTKARRPRKSKRQRVGGGVR